MQTLLIWLVLGLVGYFLILTAYIKLEGYANPRRKLQQLPAIIIGPIAIIIGLIFMFDILTDPPEK